MTERALPTPSEMARQLAARRQRVQRACLHCGQVFEGLRKRRFCSDACRARHWEATHRDQANARRRARRAERQAQPPATPAPTTGAGDVPPADLADRDQDPEERP
jgi:predicted  nucleic acid-binding Zn-ribbon protein